MPDVFAADFFFFLSPSLMPRRYAAAAAFLFFFAIFFAAMARFRVIAPLTVTSYVRVANVRRRVSYCH